MTPPLSAFDCLSRGIANLRANWQLVPLMAAQQVAVAVLSLLSMAALFLPMVFFGGWAASLEKLANMENLGAVPPELIGEELFLLLMDLVQGDLWTLVLMAAIALAPSTLVGVAALLVFSWLAGGIFGTLRDGEERAPLEEGVAWRHFRSYRWQAFSDWGGRFMWPYFWYVNYFLALCLLVTLLVLLVMGMAAWGGEAAGPVLALAVGCAGLLPCLAMFLGIVLWYLVGLVEMVRRPGDHGGSVAGVRGACRRALRVLRRRWAALMLLAALFLGATIAVGFGMSPMGMYNVGFLDASFAAWCGLQTAAYLVQIAVTSVVHVAFYGALTALVRDAAEPVGVVAGPGGAA